MSVIFYKHPILVAYGNVVGETCRSRYVFNRFYGSRWIGRAGPRGCPPLSPDLTHISLFVGIHARVRVMKRSRRSQVNL